MYSQEIRINSTDAASRLHYTAGLFGFAQVGYEPSSNLAFEVDPQSFVVFRNRTDNRGVAGYSEVSYQFTPAQKATAGLRYDHERRQGTVNNGAFTLVRPDTVVSATYSALSPKLALSYALSSRSNLYVTYTRGFRAGGINYQRVPPEVRHTFDPEFSDNYEFGYKIRSVDGRLSLGESVFWIQWRNLQFSNLVAPFTYAITNVGNARSQWIELETSAILVKGLQFDASLGLNATAYQGFSLSQVDFNGEVEIRIAITGNRLSNAPTHTLFGAAQYSRPLGASW